ncbi:hypothetical protein FJT64_024396 [Amphibalanus amphitrite]|uniref:Uncharacterized protein n=1 Tax=Amphibalanus amphitrite TaxID=1232801 RepID=A0A6A4WAR8_AMPAM|nr:hypothetical protein FJT64_024396 [Amphibalanus amphitrite]
MQRSSSRNLVAAALLVTVVSLVISSADSAVLARQPREVSNLRWSRLPKCNLGSICGFRVFGVAYDDESSFVQTCHCPWNCAEDYFNLATQVSKFRCKE